MTNTTSNLSTAAVASTAVKTSIEWILQACSLGKAARVSLRNALAWGAPAPLATAARRFVSAVAAETEAQEAWGEEDIPVWAEPSRARVAAWHHLTAVLPR